MNDHDDLRQLFHDATSDVRPQGTLDDIRNRTDKVDPMARRWFLPSLAAAAVMLAVVGGAFWFTDGNGNDDAGPARAVEPRTTAIYYLGDGSTGPRLFSEQAEVSSEPADGAFDAAEAVIAGTPADADYRSAWPKGLQVEGVAADDSGSPIQLTFAEGTSLDRPAGMSEDEARLSVEQMVRSVQDGFGENRPVQFTASSVLGIDTSAPVERGSDEDVLALVSISDVVNGATVEAGKLTVKGLAATFEANVVWEILVGGDALVDSGFTTAAEGGKLSPYEFTTNIELEGPGTYTLVVRDTDESGEGRPINQDSKEIVVE